MKETFGRRAAAIFAAGSLVAATTACHSGSSSQAGSSNASPAAAPVTASLDPCALLTPEEVGKAIGNKVGNGKGENQDLSASRSCTWETGATSYLCAKDIVSVTLQVVEPPPALKPQYPTAQAYYPVVLNTAREMGDSVQNLPGLGDAAFAEISATKKGLDLYARKGGALLRVFSICGNPATLQPALEGLMKQALAKA